MYCRFDDCGPRTAAASVIGPAAHSEHSSVSRLGPGVALALSLAGVQVDDVGHVRRKGLPRASGRRGGGADGGVADTRRGRGATDLKEVGQVRVGRCVARGPRARLVGHVGPHHAPPAQRGTQQRVDEVGARADVQAHRGTLRRRQAHEVLQPMDVVGAVGEGRDELRCGTGAPCRAV